MPQSMGGLPTETVYASSEAAPANIDRVPALDKARRWGFRRTEEPRTEEDLQGIIAVKSVAHYLAWCLLHT